MKMILCKECIKVELQGSALPEEIHYLEPYHFNRARTIYYFSRHKFPEVLRVFNKDINTLPPAVRAAYDEVVEKRKLFQMLLLKGPQNDAVISPTLTLRPHQELAREVAQIYNKFAFYYDTRTGKTPTSIAIILDDLKLHPTNKWLVIAPLTLLDLAWGEDFAKFAPDVKISICHASTKKKRLDKIQEKANVYLINTESFVNYQEYFADISGLVVDESSSMKNKSSKFSKAIVEFSRSCDRVYLLSGTPAPNGAHEYYRQIQAIDYYGIQQSFAQFKNKYFLNLARDVRFEQLVLRPDMQEELTELINQYAIYTDKEDVLNTPGRDFIERIFSMPENVKQHYKQMKSELATEIGDVSVLAPSAATKLNKLNQISSGFIMNTEAIFNNKIARKHGETSFEQEEYILSMYRFHELQALLDEIGDEQVIIWANYRLEFKYIQEMLSSKCVIVNGEISASSKIENIRAFKNKEVQYLVANPASADKGLTLTNCHICVYFSLNWSYELFKQSMDRIYGDKSIQPNKCIYYIMLAKGSVDIPLYREVLIGKQEISYAILDHLKADKYD